MSYTLEGTILEVCNCDVLCPCWIGEDPDNGTCDAVVAWHIDRGEIDGVDVSNRTIALLGFVPGNILAGNWKAAVFVDDKASDAQMQALGDVWTGKKGGPVADVAGLVGEIVAFQKAPISYEIQEGDGTLRVGNYVEAEMANADTTVLPNVSDVLLLLSTGSVDIVVIDKPAADGIVASNPAFALEGTIQTNELYGFAVPDGDPKGLIADLNTALAAIKADGTYDALIDEWF